MALEQRQHLFNVIDLLGSDHIIQHLCTDSLVAVLSAVSNDVSWQRGPWSGTSSTVLTFQSFHGSLIWTASCKNTGSTQQKNVERRKTHTRTHTELKTSEPLNKMIGTFRGLDTLGRLSTVSDKGGRGRARVQLSWLARFAFLHSEKESALKGKNLLPMGETSFLLDGPLSKREAKIIPEELSPLKVHLLPLKR